VGFLKRDSSFVRLRVVGASSLGGLRVLDKGLLNKCSVTVEASHRKWAVAMLRTETILLAMDKRFADQLATVGHVEIPECEISGSRPMATTYFVSHLK
jgi:hypothetical protein